MRSIRGKMTVLTVAAVIISILSIGVISILSIRAEEENAARQQMTLISQVGQMKLDASLNSIEQSVLTVFRFATEELNSGEEADIAGHVDLVDRFFKTVADNTNGALNYYYRIAPEMSDTAQGFWYVKKKKEGFVRSKLTDISRYDPKDINHVGWYSIPKSRGVPSWLDPYFNDNQGTRLISYVAPVYRHGVFFGVIGMDFRYSTLVERVREIHVLDTGYAFLVDAEGNIVYHPKLANGVALSSVSESLTRDRRGHQEPIVRYTQDGVEMRTAWAELSNGMFLYVTAPEAEINEGWVRLMSVIIEAAVILLACFILVTTLIVNRVTNPLRRLTEAAVQMDAGNYEVVLDYNGKDEVGILTGAFRQLTGHLKSYIEDLNSKAYTDALTSVRNKGAYTLFARKLQDQMSLPGELPPEFAICMFDCNDLKTVNDKYGHDKGDIYLKSACSLICRVFRHSPVFRLGGDEFAAVLRGEDYVNRDALLERFDRRAEEICGQAAHPWERVDAAWGVAIYDPVLDNSVDDVFRRADDDMYKRKRSMKSDSGTGEERESE